MPHREPETITKLSIYLPSIHHLISDFRAFSVKNDIREALLLLIMSRILNLHISKYQLLL